MRILEVVSELPPVRSGVARSTGRVIDGLVERGHEVRTLTTADAWCRHIGEFRFSALARRIVPIDRLCEGVDVVHVTGPAPFVADVALARWSIGRRRRCIPLVYTHGFDLELEGLVLASRAYTALTRPLMRAADRVVVTTPGYAAIVERSVGPRVSVIPWGVDDDARRSNELPPYDGGRALRVLFVGQQRPYKGIGHLIDAVARTPGVTLTIVGGGPEEQAYRDEIRALGVGDRIDHRGPLPDAELSALYGSHDVIALPSTNRSEAFGLVLLEGMAAGCLALASALPGVTDVVGDAGVLARPGDTESIRRCLVRLVGDPGLVRTLQARAITTAAGYSWESTVEAYERLLMEVVQAR